MSKEKSDRRDDKAFAIDLDESLIADALAAVERRMAPQPGVVTELGDELEIDLDALDGAPPVIEESLEDLAAALSDDEQDPYDEDASVDLTPLAGIEEDDEIFLAGPVGEPVPEPVIEQSTPQPTPQTPQQTSQPEPDGGFLVPTREQLLQMNGELEEENDQFVADKKLLAEEVERLRAEVDALTAERDESQQRARDALRKAGMMVVKARRKDEQIEQLRLDNQDAQTMIRQRDQTIRDFRSSMQDEERARERQRARISREADETKRFANEKLLKNLLPVLDHMELALDHADAEPDRIREGVDITWNQLLKVLSRAGLTAVELNTGDAFDPEHQEAMEYVDAPDVLPDHVVRVHQRGYTLNGRLIRAARVSVSAEQPSPAVDLEDAVSDERVQEE